MTQWSSVDQFKLKEKLMNLRAGGGTRVEGAMKACETEYQNMKWNTNLNRVMFLTGNTSRNVTTNYVKTWK